MVKRISLKKKCFDDFLYFFFVMKHQCIEDIPNCIIEQCEYPIVGEGVEIEECIPCAKKYLGYREEE